MDVTVELEAGYELALRGMAYSHKDRKIPMKEWWTPLQFEKAKKRAVTLSQKGGGHNKFLESIQIWIDIEAPRSFWQEFDTYRTGISKQSESTMHTLHKRRPEKLDFEDGIAIPVLNAFCDVWHKYYTKSDNVTLENLKENLPEGFLQRRMVNTNYKTFQNIYRQRKSHKYKRWDVAFDKILIQLEHPEFIIQQTTEKINDISKK